MHPPTATCAVRGCHDPVAHTGLCERHYRRQLRTGRVGPAGRSMRNIRLDAQPLLDAIEGKGGISAAITPLDDPRELARLRRAYHRAKATGTTTAATVDTLCGAADLDPGAIYGRAWWHAT